MFDVRPIGWVRKTEARTIIGIDKQYQPALRGIEHLGVIWVLYWLDRNDNPKDRSTLQGHPRGNSENPLRGVFATRPPVRPNPIALHRCRILSVGKTGSRSTLSTPFPIRSYSNSDLKVQQRTPG